MKKNKLLIFGILLGVLIISIIVGIKYKLGKDSTTLGENGVKVAELTSNEKDENSAILEEHENSFKVLIEEASISASTKFYPDLLADRYESWWDTINSAHKKYAEFFTKNAGVTTIKIKNNKTVQFIDPVVKGDGVQDYDYMFFIPEIDSHLVRCQFYEGGEFILVNNETGVTQEIWTIPSISPEKNRLAVASEDLFPRYDRNGIQIFEIVSGNYIKQFEQELDDWGPDNVRWLSNDAFIVDKYILELSTDEKKPAGQVIFKLVNGK